MHERLVEARNGIMCAVKKTAEVRMLPLECQYLNKQALNQTAGQIAQLTRHFQIKRKPKSATLRAEIVTKCKLFLCWKLLDFTQGVFGVVMIQECQLFVDFFSSSY